MTHSDHREGVIREIAAERQRQVESEGWSHQHDDEYTAGQLPIAASCYAMFSTESEGFRRSFASATVPERWPWRLKWWKPTTPRRDLIKAAALLVAEIERIDRALLTPPEVKS